jgi:hypothetical protein
MTGRNRPGRQLQRKSNRYRRRGVADRQPAACRCSRQSRDPTLARSDKRSSYPRRVGAGARLAAPKAPRIAASCDRIVQGRHDAADPLLDMHREPLPLAPRSRVGSAVRRRALICSDSPWRREAALRRLPSWTFHESQIDRREHHDNSDVRYQPLPELVPEEHDVHADHDGYKHEHVRRCLSAHRPILLFPVLPRPPTDLRGVAHRYLRVVHPTRRPPG